METTRFLDLDCVRLQNDALELLVTQSVGPRLIYLALAGEENLMAELPGATLDCPGVGPMHLWGGHRLWHAPEMKRRTYLPDDQPVAIVEIEGGIEVVQPVEAQTGLQKSLRLGLPDQSPTLVIDHILHNQGLWPVELAPWAITQLKPGGVAVLPQVTGPADPDGVLANRRLAIWPYTDVTSPHLQWGNRYLMVHANMQENALKVGFPNPTGWLAYYIDQTLFVKQAAYDPQADYLDFGSSSECYCRAEFVELETLGPKVTLAPDQAVTHRETWRLFRYDEFAPTEEAVETMVEALGL